VVKLVGITPVDDISASLPANMWLTNFTENTGQIRSIYLPQIRVQVKTTKEYKYIN
jgi:hypothetical protein